MNRSLMAATVGAAGTLILVAAFVGGYLLGDGHVSTQTVTHTVTVTKTGAASGDH